MTTRARVDILLVEDNQDHAQFILAALREDNGVGVHWVKDGDEALDFLRARLAVSGAAEAVGPLVVLLDIHLPKTNGHQVLGAMRGDEALRAIPVVMLTSSDRKNEIAPAYHAGANGYVTKPLKLGDFVEKIKTIKRYWTFASEIAAA